MMTFQSREKMRLKCLQDLKQQKEQFQKEKDAIYQERDQLVCALSKLFPSSLERHPSEDKNWEDDWRWIVFIDMDGKQLSWHIHDSELFLFAHLPRETGVKWDGHTTPEKYERLAALKPKQQPQTLITGA
jgi:hypothetical protein